MKRLAPYLILILATLWTVSSWRPPSYSSDEFDLSSFKRIPVLVGGRIKPMDTVARNSLLIIRGKQTVRRADGGRLPAARWLADLLFDPSKADEHPVFAVANQEVLGMFGWPQADKRYCTYAELKPHIPKIEEEGKLASGTEAVNRTPFQAAIFNLRNSLALYQRIRNSVHQEDTVDFTKEIETYAKAVADGARGLADGGSPLDGERMSLLRSAVARYESQADFAYLLMVAPPAGGGEGDWLSTGAALMRVKSPENIPTPVRALAMMGDAYRTDDHATFAKASLDYANWLNFVHPEWAGRTSFELRFNQMEPFYHSMVLYVAAFLLACLSWLFRPRGLRQTAFLLLILAFAVHSFGMLARMYIQGRPPVTNLYSSAIFVGWGAALLGIILERFHRDGIGAATSGMVGFITLIVSHHLGTSGDTLEMMQAVLDSNFWLATHVVVITAGYSAMFLAGFLGIAYVLLGVFTRLLKPARAKRLTDMVYGITCFAILFSFVGTVLGGIWADQSWGRFWGWDPKENGALLIVIWCAMLLHARWAGYIRQRGIMAMAIFGNAITAFSWFGVNMLGVGLHTYGFMDKAFPWLVGFVVVQMLVIVLSRLPLHLWRSPIRINGGNTAVAV